MYDKNVSIGSQLYINGDDTVQHIEELVIKMQNTGLKLIRLFMVWDTLEPKQNEWDFSLFDACFNQAERCGLKVIPTLMPVSPAGYKKRTMGSQDIDNIDDENIWAEGLEYVKKIVDRYYRHNALHSWILWNEPSRSLTINDSNIADFVEFLKRTYKSIENYNKNHFRKFLSFEDLKNCYLTSCEVLAFKPYQDEVDILDYSEYNLCKKLADIKDAIKSIDSVHPVHVNPHDVARESYTNGQNFYLEGQVVDFLGCSAHPSWHSIDFKKDRIPLSIGYFADVMKAFSKGERFWVTELQGGTNIFSGRKYLCPDYKDIRLWLAESFGSGAECSVFWCFNTRNNGFEGGEWGLLNQLEEDSERIISVRDFSKLISDNQKLFDSSYPQKPDVYVLYSDDTIRLNMLETAHADNVCRNKNNGRFSVIGAYTLISDMGLNPALIGEKNINKLSENDILILPDTFALERNVVMGIKEFIKNGGTLIADGLLGMKNRYGKISRESLNDFSEIFACRVEDVAVSDMPISLSLSGIKTNCEFLKLKLSDNGSDDLIVNDYGKGKAYRIPSVFFRHYFKEENEEYLKIIGKIINKNNGIVKTVDKDLSVRILESDLGKLVFIINAGKAKKVELCDLKNVRALTGNKLENNIIDIAERDFALLFIGTK